MHFLVAETEVVLRLIGKTRLEVWPCGPNGLIYGSSERDVLQSCRADEQRHVRSDKSVYSIHSTFLQPLADGEFRHGVPLRLPSQCTKSSLTFEYLQQCRYWQTTGLHLSYASLVQGLRQNASHRSWGDFPPHASTVNTSVPQIPSLYKLEWLNWQQAVQIEILRYRTRVIGNDFISSPLVTLSTVLSIKQLNSCLWSCLWVVVRFLHLCYYLLMIPRCCSKLVRDADYSLSTLFQSQVGGHSCSPQIFRTTSKRSSVNGMVRASRS